MIYNRIYGNIWASRVFDSTPYLRPQNVALFFSLTVHPVCVNRMWLYSCLWRYTQSVFAECGSILVSDSTPSLRQWRSDGYIWATAQKRLFVEILMEMIFFKCKDILLINNQSLIFLLIRPCVSQNNRDINYSRITSMK